MIQRCLLLLTICCSIFSLSAATIDEPTARTVAANFMKMQAGSAVGSLNLVWKKPETGIPLYYIFTSDDPGFVIVSADDRVRPILGYSTEKPFIAPKNNGDTLRGNNFWGWMHNYELQISEAIQQNIPTLAEIASQWQQLLAESRISDQSQTVVNPLLTTTWDQGWPYNALCPAIGGPGGHAWAGCTATAMAQIMKYHNWPAQGLGSYGYSYNGLPYTGANFGGTTYNWSNMPNSVSTLNNDVATLIYHAAVSVYSMWGSGSTGVGYSTGEDPMTSAFWNYFRFAYDSLRYVQSQYFSANQWDSLLQVELTHNRPVFYRGDGSISHAWVCDGVNATNMYHFNWGWGGLYNGYFALTNINPGGNNVTNNQHAIIGIKPNDGSTIVTNTTWMGVNIRNESVGVPDSITLTVNPGAVVKFGKACNLRIMGRLVSVGTETNFVKFTAIDTTLGWFGIQWANNDGRNRMDNNDSSKLVYTQVEYSKNSGIYAYGFGKILINHCIITRNWGGTGAGLSIWMNPINITNSEISYNHCATQGGGFFITTTGLASALISNNDIHQNVADLSGGGFYLMNTGNITLKNNSIHHNQSPNGGGGKIMYGSPAIMNTEFRYNNASSSGGAMYLENCSLKIINALIVHNSSGTSYSGSGGGITVTSGSLPQIVNSTIAHNNSHKGGGFIFAVASNGIIKNCVVYDNAAISYGNQVGINTTDCQPVFNHDDVQGGLAGFGGNGISGYNPANYSVCKDTIPGFVNAGVDYHILGASSLNNWGDTTGVSQFIPTQDLDGKPRYTGNIDLGPYEYCQLPGTTTISGSTNPCFNTVQTFTAASSSAASFNWTIPTGNGWGLISGQGTATISVTIGTVNGTISVVPSNPCGAGNAGSLPITVGLLPGNANIITGPSSVCQGTGGKVYTVPAITNTTNYNWTVPTGFTIVSGANTNTITVDIANNAVSGSITVYGSNACGNGQVSPGFAVAVNFVTANAGADQTIPTGTSTTLSGSAASGSGNYTWSWQPAASLVNPNIQNPQTVNLAASTLFTLTVMDGVTGCTATDQVLITVTGGILSVDATASPNPVCAGSMVQLMAITGGGSGNYTYVWSSSPAGFTSAAANPVVYPSVTSTFKVMVNDGFSTVSDSVMVTVNPLAAVPATPSGPDTVNLKTVTTSTYTTTPAFAATAYTWELSPAAAGIIIGTDTIGTVTWNSGFLGQAHIRTKAVNACGESTWSPEKTTFVDNTTGISTPRHSEITIFPNPTSGDFTLTLSMPISSAAKVAIFNLQGIKIMETKMDGETSRVFSLEGYPAGVYAIRMENGKEVKTARVVKF